MTRTSDDLRSLLKSAETKIAELAAERDKLRDDNAQLSAAYSDLMTAQQAEVEQMLKLSEQLWSLEDALAQVSGEKNDVLETLSILKNRFDQMRKQAQLTLDAAGSNATRLELAARVYEIAATAKLDDLDRKMAQYNANLARLKAQK